MQSSILFAPSDLLLSATMRQLIILITLLIIASTAQAKIYKCTMGDTTAYQAIPCKGATHKAASQTIIIPDQATSSTKSSSSQCDLPCETQAMNCRAGLKFGNYNSDGGLKVCALQEAACKADCTKASNANQLKSDYLKAKNKYQAAQKQLASHQQTEEQRQQQRQLQAVKKEEAKKQCIRNSIQNIERIFQPTDSLDASQRRRYKSALEDVEKNC